MNVRHFGEARLPPESPLRRFPGLHPPSRDMSALDVPTLVKRTDLFRDGIGLLCWVPIDEVVVPISVDTNASLGDHQGPGLDFDKRAA